MYSLPVITVFVVGFATLVVGAPRPYWGARLYGGPVEGATRLSWQLEAVERLGEVEAAAPVQRARVEATLPSGSSVSWEGALDAEGRAFVSLDPGVPAQGPVRVHVVSLTPPAELARGSVSMTREAWLHKARRRGGFIDGKSSGALRLRVAPARGVFAVPFSDPLLVEVNDEHGAVEGATLSLSPDGVDARQKERVTDAKGRALFDVTPREHAVSVRLTARKGEREGTWFGALPVIPGALHARLENGKLWLASPIVHERAYYAILDRDGRLFGDSVPLAPDSRGGAAAIVDFPKLGTAPMWCVVSSEADLASPAAVGWPLSPVSSDAPPAHTFAVADTLLLDGLLSGYAVESRRVRRARNIAAAFAVAAALLAAVLMVLHTRDARARLDQHLLAAGSDREAAARVADGSRRPWVVAIGVLGVMLGFLFLALLSMMRVR